MRFLLAIICPPLAVLSCGKYVQFPMSIILTLLIWVPGIIHAMAVVSTYNADKRTNKIINAMRPRA